MNKILTFIAALMLIAGCASKSPKPFPFPNANAVTNGMTVAQASAVMGMPPTLVSADRALWERADKRAYDGTIAGSVEFRLVDGRIIDIPDGGIISPAAAARINDEWVRRHNAKNSDLQKAEAEEAERKRLAEAEEAEKRRIAELKADAERTKEIAAEMQAAERSIVVCKDKITCGKIFALAQIYVQQNADQKIQVATDTIIETYNPTEGGKVGITVIKMPRAGTVEVVKITPSCKEEKYFERSCRLKRTAIYLGFKPFIEKSLSI